MQRTLTVAMRRPPGSGDREAVLERTQVAPALRSTVGRRNDSVTKGAKLRSTRRRRITAWPVGRSAYDARPGSPPELLRASEVRVWSPADGPGPPPGPAPPSVSREGACPRTAGA